MKVVIQSGDPKLIWHSGEVIASNNDSYTMKLFDAKNNSTGDIVEIASADTMHVDDFEKIAYDLLNDGIRYRIDCQLTEAHEACQKACDMYRHYSYIKHCRAKIELCTVLQQLGQHEKAEYYFQEMMELFDAVGIRHPQRREYQRTAFNGMTSYISSILSRTDDLELRQHCFDVVFQPHWKEFAQSEVITFRATYLKMKSIVHQALDNVKARLQIEDQMLALCDSDELPDEYKITFYHTYIKSTVAECGALQRHAQFDPRRFQTRLAKCRELLSKMVETSGEDDKLLFLQGDIITAQNNLDMDVTSGFSKKKAKQYAKNMKSAWKYYDKGLNFALQHYGANSMMVKNAYMRVAQSVMAFDPKKAQKYIERAERIHIGREDESVKDIISGIRGMSKMLDECDLPTKMKVVNEPRLHRCSNFKCANIETSENKFQVCRKCRVATYCSKRCQKYHWNHGHKKICKSATRQN